MKVYAFISKDKYDVIEVSYFKSKERAMEALHKDISYYEELCKVRGFDYKMRKILWPNGFRFDIKNPGEFSYYQTFYVKPMVVKSEPIGLED